jgi:hypothetical protein
MQDRPTPSELLATIADLLEGPVLGATRGPLQHQVRVAGNLCRILEREARLGAAHEAREVELLAGALGEPARGRDALAEPGNGLAALAEPGNGLAALAEPGARLAALALSRRLVERLAAGDEALERRAWAALVEIVRGKLAVAKPGHDAFDFSAELD